LMSSSSTRASGLLRSLDGAREHTGAAELTLVESKALVRAFSPSSILEPGRKAFRRRGPKWLL
jgi:hypothetical protein